ncbi:MaoC/PaaZ C-terminal domain-containing protein [Evansella sp. AB-rgal1]|uniref:MaoC/PaaZ C-terminal domain-containing protein n=1 Tax=Evansella sp. AB-rgal1 TaxID=3242696 RepID=UPI00359D3892
MFKKKRDLGLTIDNLSVGKKVELTKKIEDKDILLYLGFTEDSNPIYIQHDYATRTPFQKPIVPHSMINGLLTSAISMQLPGPGSSIKKMNISYPKPLYHYGTLSLTLEVIKVDEKEHTTSISVIGKDEYEDEVLVGELEVCPPYPWKPITYDSGTFENF